MFRDLKEYQEIAKIYADKVSKPENLEERRGASSEQLTANRKDAFKGVPNSASNKRAEMSKARRGDKKFEFKKPTGGAQGRTKRPEPEKSKLPSTAEIRAANQGKVGGGNAGASTDSGGTSQSTIKSVEQKPEIKKPDPTPQEKPKMGSPDSKFIKKERGKGPGFVKRGTPVAQRAENQERARNRAKEMAKARIAAKKAEMSEQKLAEKMNINPGSGRDTVNEPGVLKVYRNIRTVGNLIPNIGKALAGDKDAFKKMEKKEVERYKNPKGIERVATGIADKITGDKFDFDMRGKSKDKNTVKSSYEYDAYDLVLEYLLSTEQAATIEEANYVMTEMDAETIQSIVEMQGQINRADIIGGTPAAKNAAAGKGKYTPGKGVTKDFKLDPNFKLPGV